ncbi:MULTISPECIES: hypothetical protein [unclassified Pseudonocardia]|uniref:hypothetical protein n=2 Tax=Pseudonocardia TaxID=1847 RepID=UPI0018E90B4C|nr:MULTISPECIES: hypothetical protein [unclassified Pseudonocardia]
MAVSMGSATGIASAGSPAVMASTSTSVEAEGLKRAEFAVEGESLSPDEVRRVTEEVRYLFSVVLVNENGLWRVNPAFVHDKDFRELGRVANALNEPIDYHAFNSPKYRQCVLNAVGLGAFTASAAGGGSQLGYLMAAKKWTEVAWVLARLVGVNALKGGVVGTAAALAGAGAWCATPWAS